MSLSDPNAASRPNAQFAPTHWSVVLAAAGDASPNAEAAMESLCATYWFPIYAFLRKRGFAQEEAQDLTQEFFRQRIITGRIFRGINPAAGKFRTWMLNCVTNFLHNERDRQHAQKRGGGAPHLPIDFLCAEDQYAVGLKDDLTPEKLYDRAWASALLNDVLTGLQTEWAEAGAEREFCELKCFLPGAYSRESYANVALRLGKSENAVKVAASRLRNDFGKLLRAKVEATVSTSSEAQEELRYLIAVLAA